MNLIPAATTTSDALNAEKTRMEVIAQNIANAQTTRGEDGGPYQRRMVSFESKLEEANGMPLMRLHISGIEPDTTPGRSIFNPHHPHADEQGMVEMPNVTMSQEMVDLITSTRAYEANLNVLRTSRMMIQQTIAIGD